MRNSIIAVLSMMYVMCFGCAKEASTKGTLEIRFAPPGNVFDGAALYTESGVQTGYPVWRTTGVPGSPPLIIQHMEKGRYFLRIFIGAGYVPVERWVEVSGGKTTTYQF